MGNLPPANPAELESQLAQLFGRCGDVSECEVLRCTRDGSSRGYAFVWDDKEARAGYADYGGQAAFPCGRT